MTTQHFTYLGDKPTIESAIAQGIGLGSTCWSNLCDAGTFESERALRAVDLTVIEVRTILTGALAGLLDPSGTATEWNDAIELAIQVVEGARS